MKILVTAGPNAGLAQVPPTVPGAAVTNRGVGVLPGRQEEAETECALSAEFVPGRVVTIDFHSEFRHYACQKADVMMAALIGNLINNDGS